MALTVCPECGGKVSSSAAACPHCGLKLGLTLAEQALAGFAADVSRGAGPKPAGCGIKACGCLFWCAVAFVVAPYFISWLSVRRERAPAPEAPAALPDAQPPPMPPRTPPEPAPPPAPEPAVPPEEDAKAEADDEAARLQAQEKNAAEWMRLGSSLERQGKPEGALNYYRRVVKESPDARQSPQAAARIKALSGR